MISVGSGAARRNRWALSFADLALLLLGFFVLLQASGNRGNAVLSGVSSQFGGAAPAQRVQLAARDIFQPGEAMLTEVGRAKIGAIMRGFGDRELRIELRSAGFDGASGHYDNWDLAEIGRAHV